MLIRIIFASSIYLHSWTAIALLLFALIHMSIAQHIDLPPPGTKQIGDNLFLDIRPVSYENYYEFLHHLKTKQVDNYPQMLPDDTLKRHKGHCLWKNTKFNHYPISGLNTEQMNFYCQWRSAFVSSIKNNPNRGTCNNLYWTKMDQLDPLYEFAIVYTIPTRDQLRLKSDRLGRKLGLTEFTLLEEEINTYDTSNTSKQCFRCIASFSSKQEDRSK